MASTGGGSGQGCVEVAHSFRNRVPERVFDHGEAPARLLLGRRAFATNFVGVPRSLMSRSRRSSDSRRSMSPEMRGRGQFGTDRVVFLDERAAQNFRRVRRQHELDAHVSQFLGRDCRPRRRGGGMALLGDVGEIEELIEGAGDVGEEVLGNVRQATAEALPVRIGAAPCRLGQGADVLDQIDEPSTPMATDDATENVAQETDIVTQLAWNPGKGIVLR